MISLFSQCIRVAVVPAGYIESLVATAIVPGYPNRVLYWLP